MTTTVSEKTADAIASFMQDVIVQYNSYVGGYRRSEPRESVAIPISITPLDHSFGPNGTSFPSVTRDLSCGGIGFFHNEPIDAPFLELLVEMPDSNRAMSLLARVEHCTPCGGYYIIGCRFVGEADEVAR